MVYNNNLNITLMWNIMKSLTSSFFCIKNGGQVNNNNGMASKIIGK